MDSLTQGDRLIEVKIVVINTGGLPNTGLTVLTPLLFMTVTTGPNNSSNINVNFFKKVQHCKCLNHFYTILYS